MPMFWLFPGIHWTRSFEKQRGCRFLLSISFFEYFSNHLSTGKNVRQLALRWKITKNKQKFCSNELGKNRILSHQFVEPAPTYSQFTTPSHISSWILKKWYHIESQVNSFRLAWPAGQVKISKFSLTCPFAWSPGRYLAWLAALVVISFCFQVNKIPVIHEFF